MNEEEVKIKIVVPFLRRLGVTDGEMKFEESFSLDFGTNQIKVAGKRRTRKIRTARLDTLVTRNGRNLLVWELKDDTHEFTDEDRAQASRGRPVRS